MRGRAWARHQRERVIRRRMRWRWTQWLKSPGRLAKWNGTCGCGLCRYDRWAARQRERRRVWAVVQQEIDLAYEELTAC